MMTFDRYKDLVLFCGLVCGFVFMCHEPENRVFDWYNLVGVVLALVSVAVLCKREQRGG